jgi:hypothetical protein
LFRAISARSHPHRWWENVTARNAGRATRVDRVITKVKPFPPKSSPVLCVAGELDDKYDILPLHCRRKALQGMGLFMPDKIIPALAARASAPWYKRAESASLVSPDASGVTGGTLRTGYLYQVAVIPELKVFTTCLSPSHQRESPRK